MAEHLAALGGEAVRKAPFPTWPVFGPEEEAALLGVLRGGTWGRIDGHAVAEFERRFAEFQHARHAVAVVNGTTALRIALLAAGIRSGEEVIVPPYTRRRSSPTSTPRPSPSTPRPPKPPSRRAPARSSRSTSAACRPTWTP